jgi:HEAT repeat protein
MRKKESRKVRRRRQAAQLQSATKLMREINIESQDALLAYCADSRNTAHNRLRACSAVAGILGRTGIPFLLRLAASENSDMADPALHGLRCLGTRRATRLWIRMMTKSPDERRRQKAIDALRFLGDRRAEPAMVHVLLTSPSSATRALAAEALWYVTKGRRSTTVLLRALRDPSAEVRWWVLSTLGGIPDIKQSGLDAIRQYLSDEAVVTGFADRDQSTVADSAKYALEMQSAWAAKRKRTI